MGLLTLPLQLPLLPVRSLIRVGELIQEEAERKLHDPAEVRRQLEEAERMRATGTISDEELSRVEQDAVARLSTGGTRGTGGSGGSGTAGTDRTIGGS
jgi:hypothetical protein